MSGEESKDSCISQGWPEATSAPSNSGDTWSHQTPTWSFRPANKPAGKVPLLQPPESRGHRDATSFLPSKSHEQKCFLGTTLGILGISMEADKLQTHHTLLVSFFQNPRCQGLGF